MIKYEIYQEIDDYADDDLRPHWRDLVDLLLED